MGRKGIARGSGRSEAAACRKLRPMSMQRIHGVYLADTARVRGEVNLGRDCSLWYGAAIRGDVARVTVGEGTNIQDHAMIHCDSGVPNTIGHHVTIGHNAIVHGISVGDGSLIGMNATVLGGTTIGSGCLIAAGCVVPPNMDVPDGMLVIGVPGRIARPVKPAEQEYLRHLPEHYLQLARQYVENPNHPAVREWRELGNG